MGEFSFMEVSSLGKLLIFLGIVFVLVGIFFLIGNKIPYIGRLPGDIIVKKENFTFYFPITTSLIISILLTLIFYLFRNK